MRSIGLDAISRSALVFVMTALVAGCAGRSETVFTRQNQAAAALATMEIEAADQDSTKLDMIYAAETQLHEACGSLRDIASRRMNGEEVSIVSTLLVMFTLDRCETETTRVENLIWIENPSVARFYLRRRASPQQQ